MYMLLLIAVGPVACNNEVAPGRVPVYPAKGKVLYKGNPL
jgi:hypothetical protein